MPLRLEHVLRNVHQHRTGPSARSNIECLVNYLRQFREFFTRKLCLVAGTRDAESVRLLERIAADQFADTWPVMATIGIESIIASTRPVTRLVAPGPEVAQHTPTRPVARA